MARASAVSSSIPMVLLLGVAAAQKKIVIYGPTDSTLDDLVFGTFVKGRASAGGKGCAGVISSAARAFAVANFWPHSGVIDAWRHPERLQVR